MLYKSIPDSVAGKEYYSGKTCECDGPCRERLWAKPGERQEWDRLGYRTPFRPTPPIAEGCGKYYACLDICPSCESVFYDHFYHPYQLTFPLRTLQENLSEKSKRLCWHCLEQGISTRLSPIYSLVPKTPPIPELLNPYKDPVTLEDKVAKIKEIVSSTAFEDIFG